ncbi:hypothetical protein HMPREF1528_00401 [Capnocytophaga sp. oral taxon 336 str. F0502]|nr:hypothetical protein HMPREF1528_00401 [Capnocytophaga sp. oral taxon 336 str. F0502]
MWAVFLFEKFLRSSEVRGRNTATVARQAGKKLANVEALRGSEDFGGVRKRGGRVFDEKRV